MKKKIWTIFSFALTALASALGGPMAMAMAVEVGENGKNTDPNEGTPMEGSTPDNPAKGIDQQSHAATGSTLDQAELTENHIDDYVSKFRAYRFPLHTDILRRAKQIKVDTKEPTNWEVGEALSEFVTLAKFGTAVSGGYAAAGTEEVTLTKNTHIAGNDWKLIRKGATLMFAHPAGFVNGVADSTPLVAIVLSKDNTSITIKAANGPYKSGSDHTVVVPEIPAGTTVLTMAPAMSESEVKVEPSNALPMESTCYLQKKVCAITYTELFTRIKRKAKWNVQDIKDWTLEMFRRECTRSMLISAPCKFTKDNPDTGTEYAYTENGILRQLRLGYELADGKVEFEDLIGILAMMCGKYNTPNELTAYCGTKFIQRLLNIDFSKHNEFKVRNYTDETTKIKITSFECNFGKLNFVHEYGLDDLGYSECAVIFSVEDAKHFYYQLNKTITIDHEKGEGGEVREAKSQYYIKDDCVKLDTFNSMLVGPSNLVGGYKLSALDAILKSVNKLADVKSPAEGDIVYLTEDDSTTTPDTIYTLGLYEYNGTKWVPSSGKNIYVA